MKRKWLHIVVTAEVVLVEAISDFLVGVIGAGVEVGVVDEIYSKTINAYLHKENHDEEEIAGISEQLSAYFSELAQIFTVKEPVFALSFFHDEDWGNNWKKHFKPFEIVPDLIIAPTWENYQSVQGQHVITMDPGMAFGTGHHATTRMSLQFLKEVLDDSHRSAVLDIGTGTGILGMASALFGAASVLGVDNDPEAVVASHDNVQRNNLERCMSVALSPLASLEEGFTLLVANIIHDVLIEMAEDIHRLTVPGGKLVLSGLLQGKQVENIVQKFTKLGYVLLEEKAEMEWAALLFEKNDYSPTAS